MSRPPPPRYRLTELHLRLPAVYLTILGRQALSDHTGVDGIVSSSALAYKPGL